MAWSRQELGRLEQYNANAKKDFQIQGYIGYPVNFQSIHLESIRGPPTMPCTMETEVSRATRNMWFPRQYILNGPWDSKWLWGRATLTIVVTKGISVQRTGEWGQIEIIWKKYVPGRWNSLCKGCHEEVTREDLSLYSGDGVLWLGKPESFVQPMREWGRGLMPQRKIEKL